MRVAFFGQFPFGQECMKALLQQGEQIVLALTPPDAPGQSAPDPVKVLALEKGIPVLQPSSLNTPEFMEQFRSYQPDLLVLVGITKFIPAEAIQICRIGAINFHPSLLPKGRGGSAMKWAILNELPVTGATIHFINPLPHPQRVDDGDIILQRSVEMDPDETERSLFMGKLFPLGVEMIAEAVRLIGEGRNPRVPQNEAEATFEPLVGKEQMTFSWMDATKKIYKTIRANDMSTGGQFQYRGETVRVWAAKQWTEAVCHPAGKPGEIMAVLEGQGLVVATGDGYLLVEKIQPKGGKRQNAAEFARSQGLRVGDNLY